MDDDSYKDALYDMISDKITSMSVIQLFYFLYEWVTIKEIITIVFKSIKKGNFLDSVQTYAFEIALDEHPEDILGKDYYA